MFGDELSDGLAPTKLRRAPRESRRDSSADEFLANAAVLSETTQCPALSSRIPIPIFKTNWFVSCASVTESGEIATTLKFAIVPSRCNDLRNSELVPSKNAYTPGVSPWS